MFSSSASCQDAPGSNAQVAPRCWMQIMKGCCNVLQRCCRGMCMILAWSLAFRPHFACTAQDIARF